MSYTKRLFFLYLLNDNTVQIYNVKMTTSNLFYRQQKNLQNFGIWDTFSLFSKNKICNFLYWLINIKQGPIYFEMSALEVVRFS